MPRFPSSASAPTSVLRPSTGVWSSFQSALTSTRPAAHSSITATVSGIECAIRTNSTSKGPMRGRLPGSASFSSAVPSSPCSSSFDWIIPSVSRVAQTSGIRTSRIK